MVSTVKVLVFDTLTAPGPVGIDAKAAWTPADKVVVQLKAPPAVAVVEHASSPSTMTLTTLSAGAVPVKAGVVD